MHTDLRRTGWFACSDDRVNRLHELAVWSFRGNACDIPTDCPHRERAGWTGDYQLYIPTAAYLYDVAGFTEKWLQGVVADQRDNGVILNFSPDPHAAPGDVDVEPEPWDRNQGSSGWCEAIIIVPWQMYLSYGDRKSLKDCYPSMLRWHDYCRRQAETKRHRTVEELRPDPAPHDRYLWDTGYHWGEWLEAGETATPHNPDEGEGIVATAYYYWGTHLLAKIAGTLGHDEDACRFAELAVQDRGGLADRVPRRRRAPRPRHPVHVCAGARVRPDPEGAAGGGGRSAGPAGARRRHPPVHRASSPRRCCCPLSPTTAMLTSPSTCWPPTPSRRGWR